MNAEVDPKNIHIVNTGESLVEAIALMRNAAEIAVDTESDSLFVYYEKVCLIQITADGESYLIDPLETGDLSPLGELFANEKILKIFHAAEYDLICLKRDYHFTFTNLFDTMLAARILGRKEVGLGPLIENEFGIHLEKKYQKANWGIRPLSKEMMQYAVLDTRFLSALKERFSAELKERGLDDIAQEDFQRLCDTPAGFDEPPVVNWWRIAGNTELSRAEIGALQGLCEFREKMAQQRDLPTFKVISNTALLNIVQENPQKESDLRKVKGLGPATIKRYGRDILNINRRDRNGRKVPMPPVSTRPDNSVLQRKDRLRNWRKNFGLDMDVPSDVILPKDVMEKIAESGPQTMEELQGLMESCPARFRRFGSTLLSVSLGEDSE